MGFLPGAVRHATSRPQAESGGSGVETRRRGASSLSLAGVSHEDTGKSRPRPTSSSFLLEKGSEPLRRPAHAREPRTEGRTAVPPAPSVRLQPGRRIVARGFAQLAPAERTQSPGGCGEASPLGGGPRVPGRGGGGVAAVRPRKTRPSDAASDRPAPFPPPSSGAGGLGAAVQLCRQRGSERLRKTLQTPHEALLPSRAHGLLEHRGATRALALQAPWGSAARFPGERREEERPPKPRPPCFRWVLREPGARSLRVGRPAASRACPLDAGSQPGRFSTLADSALRPGRGSPFRHITLPPRSTPLPEPTSSRWPGSCLDGVSVALCLAALAVGPRPAAQAACVSVECMSTEVDAEASNLARGRELLARSTVRGGVRPASGPDREHWGLLSLSER